MGNNIDRREMEKTVHKPKELTTEQHKLKQKVEVNKVQIK